MSLKNILFFLLLIICSSIIYGQNTYPDCINPKLISIPIQEEVLSADEIYYQAEDKYTYWYKLKVLSNTELSYQLNSINTADEYEMLMYKYADGNFCEARIKNKIKPISISTKGEISVKKGEIYYWSVAHLKGNGCGHILDLADANKKTTIKAIQNECVEDALVVDVDTVENLPIKDTVVIVKSDSLQDKIHGVVVNAFTQKNITATVTLTTINENEKYQIQSDLNNGFELNNIKKEKVFVSIDKFGYEKFRDTITLKQGVLKLELNPIKVGEKLVMYHIYFHPNTYALKNESKKELEKLKQFMLENKAYIFEIQGHTNGNRMVKKTKQYENLGEEWNFKGSSKKLSKLRAEKIKTYLLKNGVLAKQLQTVGYGGDKMIVSKPKTMKQAMKNIRVEVIVVQ